MSTEFIPSKRVRMQEYQALGLESPRIKAREIAISAYRALVRGKGVRADKLWSRALRLDPGLGLIGEISPHGDTNEPTPDQSYYWTPEWQRDERKADADILNGRVTKFSSVAVAIQFLRGLY